MTAVSSRRRWLVASCLGLFLLNSGLGTGLDIGLSSKALAHGAEPPADIAEDLRYANSLSNAFEYAAGKTEGAVVHITKKALIQNVSRDLFGRRYRVGEPSLRPMGLGSGVIFDAENGLILTNNHVIDQGDEFIARLADGREYQADLVGRDELLDVAVLHIDAKDLQEAEFGDSDKLHIGEWVLAVGSPFGIDQTVTAGIISAKRRKLPGSDDLYQEYLQTDAAINPGNSGGPLINLEGKVIGINTAIVGSAQQSAGLGFAIPSLLVKRAVDTIVESGRIERAWLGVQMEDLSADERHDLSLESDEGVRISGVINDSPAEKAGLRAGDIVLMVDGRRVEGGQNRLRNLIALARPGSEITIEVLRGDDRKSLTARLEELKSSQLRVLAERMGGEAVPDLGIVTKRMTAQRARSLGYLRPFGGDEVIGLMPNGPASEAGVQQGDIITERRERKNGDDRLVRLQIVRGSQQGAVEIKLN